MAKHRSPCNLRACFVDRRAAPSSGPRSGLLPHTQRLWPHSRRRAAASCLAWPQLGHFVFLLLNSIPESCMDTGWHRYDLNESQWTTNQGNQIAPVAFALEPWQKLTLKCGNRWKQRKPTVTRSVRQRLWVWWILNHFDLAKVSLWAEGAAPYYSHLFGHVWIFEHGANANSTFHSIGRVSNGLERLPVAVSLRLHCGHSFHDSCLDRWFEERRLDEKQWITWNDFQAQVQLEITLQSSTRGDAQPASDALATLLATSHLAILAPTGGKCGNANGVKIKSPEVFKSWRIDQFLWSCVGICQNEAQLTQFPVKCLGFCWSLRTIAAALHDLALSVSVMPMIKYGVGQIKPI